MRCRDIKKEKKTLTLLGADTSRCGKNLVKLIKFHCLLENNYLHRVILKSQS